jgi:hypothetical protein
VTLLELPKDGMEEATAKAFHALRRGDRAVSGGQNCVFKIPGLGDFAMTPMPQLLGR